MLLKEKSIIIPINNEQSLIPYFENYINNTFSDDEIVIRFVVTSIDEQNYHCELGVLGGLNKIRFIRLTRTFFYEDQKASI